VTRTNPSYVTLSDEQVRVLIDEESARAYTEADMMGTVDAAPRDEDKPLLFDEDPESVFSAEDMMGTVEAAPRDEDKALLLAEDENKLDSGSVDESIVKLQTPLAAAADAPGAVSLVSASASGIRKRVVSSVSGCKL
jgi:hypothetical protein